MSAMIIGEGLGLNTSSIFQLGVRGVTRNALQGSGNERVHVNLASGNLVVQTLDETLFGPGLSIASLRTYNSQGKLEDDEHASGLQPARLQLHGDLLDDDSRLVRIDSDGSEQVFHFDERRGLYLSTDGAGAYDSIRYDRKACELIVIDGDTGIAEHYQKAEKDEDDDWLLANTVDPDGNTLTYRYNCDEQIVSILNRHGEGTLFEYHCDVLVELCTLVLEQGELRTGVSVRYAYDDDERLTSVTVDLSPADQSIADGNIYVTRYQYDGDSQRMAGISQSDGSATRIGYAHIDGEWRVVSLTNAMGQLTSIDYEDTDGDHRNTRVTDPMGLITRYDYDNDGQLTAITGPDLPDGAIRQSFLYNDRGDLIQITDGRSQTTVMEYDRNGNCVLQRDAAGNTIVRSFDAQNQLQSETLYRMPDEDGAGPLQPTQAETTHYIYDDAHRNHLRFVVSPEGRVTEYRYSASGQRISELRYQDLNTDSAAWRIAYPVQLPAPPCEDDDPVFDSGYQGAAPSEDVLVTWLATQNASASQRTDYRHDFRGQLQSQTQYQSLNADGTGVLGGSQSSSHYVYDAHGKLLQTVSGTGGITAYTYDGLNRLLTSTDPLGALGFTRYDDAGNRILHTQANGLTTIQSQDQAGRLIVLLQTDAQGAVLSTTRYDYDNAGRLRRTEDATGVQHWYLYDDAGRMNGEIDADGSLTETVYDNNGQRIQTIRYATPVSGLLAPVMQAEAFTYPGKPSISSLDQLGLSDTATGSLLKALASFETSDTGLEQARRLPQSPQGSKVAMRFTTSLTLFEAGEYSFYTRSDSGSRLYVDGQLVVDNDGLHGARTMRGNIALQAGRHSVVEVSFGSGEADNAFGLGLQATSFGPAISVDGATASERQITLPALPAGSKVLSSELQLADVIALGKSELDDLHVAIKGVVRLSRTEVSDRGQAGLLSPNPISIALPDTPVRGGVLSLTVSDSKNQAGVDATIGEARLIVTYQQDALTRLRPAANAADSKTWTVYDAAGRVIASIDAEGQLTQSEYDGAGRLISQRRYANAIDTASLPAAPTLAHILPTTDSGDRVQRSFYDADGLLRATLDAEGYLQEIRYNGAAQAIQHIRYASRTDPTLRTTGSLASLLPVASGDDIISHTAYDAAGRPVVEIDAESYLSRHSYDGSGQRIATVRHARTLNPEQTALLIQSPALAADLAFNSAADQHQSWQYDAAGRLIAQIDSTGTLTRYQYNTVGQLTDVTVAVGTDEARSRQLQYDLHGRVVAELSGEGSALLVTLGKPSDAQVQTIWAVYGSRSHYDAAGRKISTTDANGQRRLYYYNADGQLRYLINGAGEVSVFDYDTLNRQVAQTQLSQRIDADLLAQMQGGLDNGAIYSLLTGLARPGSDSTTRSAYDRAGRVVQVADALGTATALDYDSFGQIVARKLLTNDSAIETTYRYDARGLLIGQVDDKQALAAESRFEFDAFGRLIASTDANGNTRSQQFDRLGRVVQTRDATDAVQSTNWDAFSRELSRTDALGNTTRFSYDQATRSSTMVSPEGIAVTTVFNHHGQTQSVTDGNGVTHQFQYNHDGQLIASDNPLASTRSRYDHGGRLLETIDPNGNLLRYSYDAANRMVSRSVDPDGLALTTRYVWDAQGRMVQRIDAKGTQTLFQYDAKGQLLQQVIDPDGLALRTSYTWDERGQQLSVTDANGVTTAYHYDGLGRRVQELVDPQGLQLTTRYRYDANGNLIARTNANGNTSHFAYDVENRLRYSVDASGGVSEPIYDAAGRIVQSVRYAQAIDLAGLQSDTASIAARIIPDPTRDVRQSNVWDGDKRLLYSIDGAGGVSAYHYDGNGNVIERRAYAKAIDLAAWQAGVPLSLQADDAHDLRVRTLYDAANRAIATLDGTGGLSLQRYDSNGNVLERIRLATALPTDAAFTADSLAQWQTALSQPGRDARMQWTYDAANRVTHSIDGVGALTRNVYDRNGNLIRSIAFAQTLMEDADPKTLQVDQDARVTDYLVDAAGRLQWQLDALGTVTRFQRDANGRVLSQTTYAHRPPSLQQSLRSLPDASTLQTLLIADFTRDRSLRFAWDAAGRQVAAIDAEGALTTYHYDRIGQELARTQYATAFSDAELEALDAQALDMQASARAEFIASRVPANPQADRSSQQVFDAAGHLVAQVDAEGTHTRNQYDALGRLLRRERYAQALQLGEDPLDPSRPTQAQDRSESWNWDAASRMRSHTDALGQTESWDYDALGQRLAWRNVAGNEWHYAYDANGRMITEITPPVTLATVAHDARGDLVLDQTIRQSVITRMAYDALGNLIARTEAAGRPEERTTRYAYDAVGHQTATWHEAVDVYDFAQRSQSTQSLSSQTRYDSFGNAVAGIDVAGNSAYKLYDRMGRVEAEIDAAGHVTRYGRNAFGEVIELIRHARAIDIAAATDAAGLRMAVQGMFTDTDARSLIQTLDRNGRVVQVSEAPVSVLDSSAAPGMQTFEAGKTTRNRYDAFGQLVETAQLKNALTKQWIVSHSRYDRLGRQVASVDAMGYLSTQSFDAFGNVLEQIEYANALSSPDAAPLSSQDDRIVRNTWDAAGRKTSLTQVQAEIADAATPGTSRRADLRTHFGYDTVGNQISVTTADGNTGWTWYDVLGRIHAVAAPDQAGRFALSSFQRDAHGNVLAQRQYALGATSADAQGYELAGASAQDRLTLNRYDRLGRLVQSTDATGVSHFQSFDAKGYLAKSWQVVTDGITGERSTLWQLFRHDALGQEIERTEGGKEGSVSHVAAYNAFGEVVAEGTDGNWHSFNDYDRAGRLWRSNAEDGQVKIFLRDLQGNVTAQLQSNGQQALPDTLDAAITATHVRRTDIRYDLLGRAIGQSRSQQTGTYFRADATWLRWSAPATGVQQSLWLRVAESDEWNELPIESLGQEQVGVNVSALTPGQYEFELRQFEIAPASAASMDAMQSASNITSLAGHLHIQAGQDAQQVGADGLPPITNLSVRTSVVGGITSTTDAAAWLAWGNAGPGSTQQLQFRRADSNDAWQSLPVSALGNGYFGVKRNAMPAGRYEFRLQLTPADGSAPRIMQDVLTLNAYQALGVALAVRDAAGNPVGGTAAKVLQWALPPTGSSASLRARAVPENGADWIELPILTEVVGVDAPGNPVGAQKAVLNSLDPGHWEFELSFLRNGEVVARATGELVFTDSSALPTLTDTTPPYVPAYIVPANARVVSVFSTQASQAQAQRTLDRWANVLAEADPRNAAWITRYRYDANNQLLEEVRPDAGQGAPVTRYGYDSMGNLIGVLDANGHLNSRAYDASGNLLIERQADGGVVQHIYDLLGNEVVRIDANGNSTAFEYDALGRLTAIRYPDQSIARMQYDEAGRNVAATDGMGATTRMRYDARGNLVEIIQPLGGSTRHGYDSHNRKIFTQNATGEAATWRYDDFGQLQDHTDLGGAKFNYRYDAAGQLLEQTNTRSLHLQFAYDEQGQLAQILDLALGKQSIYAYDLAGRRIVERTVQQGQLLQDNQLRYDALGRLVQATDRASGVASVQIDYDRVGNRTRIQTDIDSVGASQHSTGWYAYDAMNRQVLVNAASVEGDLGSQGHRLTYDAAGNRSSATWQGNTGTLTTAHYAYDSMQRLTEIRRDGLLVQTRSYDAASRMTYQTASVDDATIEALNQGVDQADQLVEGHHWFGYDANGNQLRHIALNGDGSSNYDVNNSFDAAGKLRQYTMTVHGENGYTNTFTHQYVAFEDQVISATYGSSTQNQPGSSARQYDVNGNLVGITDAQKSANNRAYSNDAAGQALLIQQGPNQLRQLIVNGQVLGRYGATTSPVQAKDADGNPQFVNLADLNFTFQTVNDAHPAGQPISYSVLAGDTLKGIARQIYGDSGYWYRIADANGLQADGKLRAGQQLKLPALTGTDFNRADSMRPYDSGAIVGDTTPTLPPPPPDDGGCGVIGTLIVIVVAVVVAYFAPMLVGPLISSLGMGVAATAVAVAGASAALGSIASQLVGMAIGVQSGFSWSQVGLSALSAGFTQGLSGVDFVNSGAANSFGNTVTRAAVSNALTQGVGVATGLQDRFSWTSVAASGVGAGVGWGVSEGLGIIDANGDRTAAFKNASVGERLVKATVTSFSAGAATAVARGGRVAVQQIAVDAFGSALGNAFVEMKWSDASAESMKPRQSTDLGSGLRVSSEQAAAWGPQFSSASDYALQRPDYSLLAPGQTVRLATMMGEPEPQATRLDWDPDGTWKSASGPTPVDVPIAGLSEDFMRGWNDPKGSQRSIMDAPATTSETIGRYTSATADSVKNFAGTLTGYNSITAAQASWRAGNYGTSLLQGAQAFGEAGITVFGFGLGTTGRYGATMTAAELAAVRGTYADSAANLSAYEIRFSQNSVSFGKMDRATGQAFTYDDLVTSMRTNGWKGDSVDVVHMRDNGLTSIDNSRIRAAREAGIDVQANVRPFDSPLTMGEVGRFAKGSQVPRTWGDAIMIRINSQSGGFGVKYPNGADALPRMTGRPQ